jgi:intraflagellar transport protein 122
MSFYRIQGNTQKLQAEKALQYYPCSFALAGANSNKSNYLVNIPCRFISDFFTDSPFLM